MSSEQEVRKDSDDSYEDEVMSDGEEILEEDAREEIDGELEEALVQLDAGTLVEDRAGGAMN